MRIANSVIDLIGRTPLMALHKLQQAHELYANLIAKVESMNPAGSAKDRIARQMILDAEEKGLLKPSSVIIEPTSGNTGIGLASIASARGYRTILTMPETMSLERRNLLKAYGAELVLTEGSKGMRVRLIKLKILHGKSRTAFWPGSLPTLPILRHTMKPPGPKSGRIPGNDICLPSCLIDDGNEE